MSAKEWAQTIVRAREQYTDRVRDKEEVWKIQVAYSAACVFALTMAGAVEELELCNALTNYISRIPEPFLCD